MSEERFQAFYAVVRAIPAGKVLTYGRVAALAGLPGLARQVGKALFQAPSSDLPWQRVINAQGRISLPEPEASEQRELLAREGVLVREGRVDLKQFLWQPENLADLHSQDSVAESLGRPSFRAPKTGVARTRTGAPEGEQSRSEDKSAMPLPRGRNGRSGSSKTRSLSLRPRRGVD